MTLRHNKLLAELFLLHGTSIPLHFTELKDAFRDHKAFVMLSNYNAPTRWHSRVVYLSLVFITMVKLYH